MTWRTIEQLQGLSSSRSQHFRTGIGASLTKRKRKGDRVSRPARLRLSILGSVAEQFGWKDGDKFAVAIGEGQHAGWLKVKQDDDGPALLTFRKAARAKWFYLELGHIAEFPDRQEMLEDCKWENGVKGEILVCLPSWAQPSAPVEGGVTALKRPSPADLPQPARRDPGRLPGDPEPGRSALDQKRRSA